MHAQTAPSPAFAPERSHTCYPLLLSDTVIEDIGTLRGYGAHVTVIDTLPKGLGDISDLTGKPQRMIEGVPDQRFYDEAWVATVQQRRITIRECERSGVHVSPWRGGQP